MPIIGLTDTGPQFPKIGTLRKGAPKPNEKQPGADLKDSFRFDTDSADAATAFRAAYGDKPNNIRVMLMFGTVEENFAAWKEHYSAGALKRRCDGQTCSQRLTKDGTYDFTPTACECALRGLQKPHACVSVGRLKVVIPELARMGYVLVGTTSIHDIIELQSNLEAAAALRGDLRGIPFVLSRRPRKVSIPGDEGKRRRMEKWLLSLEPAPDWVRLQIVAMQRAALPVAETLALPAPVDEETGEILDDEPELEPLPAPTTWKLTGYLSGIDARYNELGDFYFKATLGHSDGKITVVAKDATGEALNDLPAGSEVTLHGYMAHNTKRNLDYLDVQSFDAVPPPIAQSLAHVAKDIDADIDALEAEYAALIEKEQLV